MAGWSRILVSLCVLLTPTIGVAKRASHSPRPVAVQGVPWQGFADKSVELRTDRYDFAAGGCNCNYYDGDFGDMDGDGH